MSILFVLLLTNIGNSLSNFTLDLTALSLASQPGKKLKNSRVFTISGFREIDPSGIFKSHP